MLFFRIFQHLLPRSQAWSLTIAKALRSLFYGPYTTDDGQGGQITRIGGLAGVFGDARSYVDGVWTEMFPDSTSVRALTEFEKQFGIVPSTDEATRRLDLAAAWAAQGGQSPKYLQDVLRAAGFDVYVYDWWISGPTTPLAVHGTDPYVARDPRNYTETPIVGTVQCSEFSATQWCCSEFPETQGQCNEWLANDPKYIVNLDLTPKPPPPVPSDSSKWPHFWYVAGTPTIDDPGYVQISRRAEFLRLLQKLKPSQTWVVYNVVFEPPLFDLVTEADEPLMTEADDQLIAASAV